MLLDPETWDLVQRIDPVLAAVAEGSSRRGSTPSSCSRWSRSRRRFAATRRGRRAACESCARTSAKIAAARGLPLRLRRHAPLQPFRAAADHREGPLPPARRPDAVHRAARADLRHARPRRSRRPRQGDPGRERAPRPPARVPRPVGELAVLARRADRPDVVAADGLLGVPALGRPAALRELRGVRRGGRAARAHRLHRRLHAYLVGRPPPPPARHGRAADLRRGDPGRGRGRAHRLLPGAREDAERARRRRSATRRASTGS